MKYKDIFKKWKTGDIVKREINLINAEVEGKIFEKTYQHYAPLGEFLREYIGHLNIPKRKQKYDWETTEEQMREILNVVTIDFKGH